MIMVFLAILTAVTFAATITTRSSKHFKLDDLGKNIGPDHYGFQCGPLKFVDFHVERAVNLACPKVKKSVHFWFSHHDRHFPKLFSEAEKFGFENGSKMIPIPDGLFSKSSPEIYSVLLRICGVENLPCYLLVLSTSFSTFFGLNSDDFELQSSQFYLLHTLTITVEPFRFHYAIYNSSTCRMNGMVHRNNSKADGAFQKCQPVSWPTGFWDM